MVARDPVGADAAPPPPRLTSCAWPDGSRTKSDRCRPRWRDPSIDIAPRTRIDAGSNTQGVKRMSRSDVRVGAFLLVAGLLGLPTARADILVEGTKYIEPHAILLADRFDDYCEHRVTIRAGDTLEAIARAAYDNPARASEIAKANPGVVATSLKIGSTLLLPAQKTPP